MDERLANAGVREGQPDDPDDEFVGTVTVPWFGRDVDVEVIFRLDDNCPEPTSKQIDAFCHLLPSKSPFFADLPEALLTYYNRARDESPLDAETISDLFPQINDARDLDRLIDLRGILVWYYDGDWSSYIGILAECRWEEEHGLGIKVVGGVPTEFGNQDLVI